MVNRLVLKLTETLVSNQYISSDEREQYVYAIESMVESMLTLLSIIVIAIFVNELIETIGFLVFFLITLDAGRKLILYFLSAIIVCGVLLLAAKISGQEVKTNEGV